MRLGRLVIGVFIILSLLTTVTLGCSQQPLPGTLTDDLDREVINPSNIEEVYEAESRTYPHPISGLPVVLPNAGYGGQGRNNGN